MLKIVTTASNAMEAELAIGRLSEAGIHCMQGSGVAWGVVGGGSSVYVEETDLDRAREVLRADEGGFDEEELVRLSDEAGEEAMGDDSSSTPPTQPKSTDREVEPPEPEKHGLFETLENLAKGKHGTDGRDSPFGC